MTLPLQKRNKCAIAVMAVANYHYTTFYIFVNHKKRLQIGLNDAILSEGALIDLMLLMYYFLYMDEAIFTVEQAEIDDLFVQYPATKPEWLQPMQIARLIVHDNVTFPGDPTKLDAICRALKVSKPQAEEILTVTRSHLEQLLQSPEFRARQRQS